MPVSAKNAGRKEQAAKAAAAKSTSQAINQMNNAMTEEEKMAAMFAAQTEQWSAQQEEMSQYVSPLLVYLPTLLTTTKVKHQYLSPANKSDPPMFRIMTPPMVISATAVVTRAIGFSFALLTMTLILTTARA